MKRKHVLLSEVEGVPAVCFDTGLEPRSFARTKMSQSLIEAGYIVYPDGSNEVWKSTGVCVHETHMRVFGKHFDGTRFDSILSGNTQTALQAVIFWLKAKMFLGDTHSTLNPAATFINSNGSVFFSPPHLSNRCLYLEGNDQDKFNCPDLMGMDAVAFCAGTMLYKILSGTLPYAAKETIYQDMREGIFLPIHLAAKGLNKDICTLIQNALLLPVEKKPHAYNKKSLDIIGGMLSLLTQDKGFSAINISSLFTELSQDEIYKREKEKKNYLFRQNTFVKTRRFASRNKIPIIGISLALAFVIFIFFSMSNNYKNKPTTAGMLPDSVVFAYYNAFSNLDHFFMEACIQGSDSTIRNDLNAAATFFAVARTRQGYSGQSMPIISARAWKDSGGEFPAPDVFGVTDLTLEKIVDNEFDGMIIFRANYNLWAPNEHARRRTDTLTLRQDRRKNWRITEILRTER